MKRIAICVGLLMTSMAASALPAHAHGRPRLSIDPLLACATGGGADLTLTIANDGHHRVIIDPDIHLQLDAVGPGGRRSGVVAFVFPAPGWDEIPPGQERTFLIDLGTAFEGDPGLDLSGARLLLDVQVWLRGMERPVEGITTFPACNQRV